MVHYCRGCFLIVLAVLLILLPLNVFSGDPGLERSDISGSWKWIDAVTPKEKIFPLENETYLVIFSEEGRIHMKVENNVINGTYEVDGASLKLNQPLMMTMAAWLPDSPAPRFVSLMEHAAHYFYKDGILHIDTYADGGTLRFQQAE